ncbi:MAG: M20 family metallo-hydrolase [Oligoflexales bacterium]
MTKTKNRLSATELLKKLVSIPSVSREEGNVADFMFDYLKDLELSPQRQDNNVWVASTKAKNLPTILLNSHLDTVKPSKSYTRDPFAPTVEGDKIYGLGSNDAGASVVSLLETFLNLKDVTMLPFNLVYAATAEEEISGSKNLASIVPLLGKLDFAVVGEPTGMDIAVAEKGLMVVDCEATGKAGHAARDEGVNAIYLANDAISWARSYKFDKVSSSLGPVKMTVTQIEAGTQHNVVPDSCRFVMDVRTTDSYTNEEVLAVIRDHMHLNCKARSLRLEPSSIAMEHPFVQSALRANCKSYGSPTLSDQAVLRIPSVKIGPGQSARSHTADEFVLISEIENGIEKYKTIFTDFADTLGKGATL